MKEESDYHDLESVVQRVEQNLELMTVRRGQGRALAGCEVGAVSPRCTRALPWAVPEAIREQRRNC